ncbi:MAG: UDP-4-amino-4,6-dideoxy-N-acetyl-beta-L-altrosamine transaminase [Pseudomonadota bacterium]
MISYGRQTVCVDDIEAVVAVLESDNITQGSRVTQFEALVARYCNVENAVALNNGTMALNLCCQALGLKSGGLLWTSPNSFAASANCAHYCGADVDFVDIEIATGNMDVAKLEKKLQLAALTGRLPDIVIPVHFAGRSCDMRAIGALARQYGFRVIEDACHALGGRYLGEPVGSCRWSDATIFSFHPVKSITTAEGGMVVTRDGSLAGRVRTLANGGVVNCLGQHAWYREMAYPGVNGRMSEIHASLGISQMAKLDDFLISRRAIAYRYLDALKGVGIELPIVHHDYQSAWHLFVIHVDDGRDELCMSLRRAGISVNVHYVPIHTFEWYRQRGFKSGDFPLAEKHFKTAITLPLYPSLSQHQLDYVINTLCQSLREVA